MEGGMTPEEVKIARKKMNEDRARRLAEQAAARAVAAAAAAAARPPVSAEPPKPPTGKGAFIKRYLKGQGLPATKRNIKAVSNFMDAEGIC
jgi:sRNA-binding protein